jgi:dGTPase
MEDRLSYLRALAINTLISDATDIFIKNESEIIQGSFNTSLLDKSNYQAQIKDILSLSAEKVYRSQEVIEKEIAGYRIIADILEAYSDALVKSKKGVASNYDKLLMTTLPPRFQDITGSLYTVLLNCCCYVASLSDSAAVHIHNKISGKQL